MEAVREAFGHSGYLVMALAPSIGWLFVGRVISGITGATWTTAGAYIADVTPREQIERLRLLARHPEALLQHPKMSEFEHQAPESSELKGNPWTLFRAMAGIRYLSRIILINCPRFISGINT